MRTPVRFELPQSGTEIVCDLLRRHTLFLRQIATDSDTNRQGYRDRTTYASGTARQQDLRIFSRMGCAL